MGWYLRNWAVYDFDFYLSEISIKNPNFWYMSWVTAFDSETFYNFYWGVLLLTVVHSLETSKSRAWAYDAVIVKAQ